MPKNRARLLTILQNSRHLLDKTDLFLRVLTTDDALTRQAYDQIRHYVMELRKDQGMIEEALSQPTHH